MATRAFDCSYGKVFQSVGRRYVQYFNFTHRRSGTLREGRLRATVVDSEPYLLTLIRCIELNPGPARMVAHPEDHPWWSYRHHPPYESASHAD